MGLALWGEADALWVWILSAKYGTADVNGWSLGVEVDKSGSRIFRAWWRLCEGRSEVGRLFRGKLRILVGKGNPTFFFLERLMAWGVNLWIDSQGFLEQLGINRLW